MNTEDPPQSINIGTTVEVLLAEFRALYGLLEFRRQALDGRTPVLTGLLAVLLGTLKAMEPAIALALLGGIPIGSGNQYII